MSTVKTVITNHSPNVVLCQDIHDGSNLFYLNDGLPCTNINKIKLNPILSSIAIFCCTDSGVYLTHDISIGIDDLQHKNIKLTNYPNPYDKTTTIEYLLPETSKEPTILTIYNTKGEIIERKELKSTKGRNTFTLCSDKFEAGVYLYSIQSGELIITNKMTILK